MSDPVRCRACGGDRLETFYEARGIPVESCLFTESRSEALAFPTGDLRLDACTGCGFIQNSCFDPTLQAQTARYEDSQAASPTFGRFARELALGLVERHALQHRRTLEIGCGRGEFLRLLCDLSQGEGVGIDPLATEDRVRGVVRPGLRFIPEPLRESHGEIDPALVACRHTLEHVRDVADFLGTLRRALGARSPVLYFEVPDTGRILRERAFWDVYYEHCSYFTAGSLSRAFRAQGFRILDVRLGFGDQYLLLEAVPEGSASDPGPDVDLGSAEDVGGFSRDVAETLRTWSRRFREFGREPGSTVLWGAGSKAVAFLTTLRLGEEVGYVVDIDTRKQGKYLPGTGHEIVHPGRLREQPPARILVMNPIYLKEIGSQVATLGLAPEFIPVS